MIMMGTKFKDITPFKDVYIHAIVRDKLGRKMSKSLGNGIDPIDTIQEHGADAFRFTLASGSGYNRTLNLDPERIGGYRNFINKIWNAFRFIQPFLESSSDEKLNISKLDHHERWIISELNSVIEYINKSFNEYRFDDTCNGIYHFVYEKFCSWFIELSKPILYGKDLEKKKNRVQVLKYTFREIVKSLHPITPFITEELWGELKNSDEDLLIIQQYPTFKKEYLFEQDQEKMNKFIDMVQVIRNLRANLNVKPKEKVNIQLFVNDSSLKSYFEDNKRFIFELSNVESIEVKLKINERPEKSVMGAAIDTEVFLILDKAINLEEQILRVKKELEKTMKEFNKVDKKVLNPKFINNAKPDVVEKVKKEHEELKEKIDSLEKNLSSISL